MDYDEICRKFVNGKKTQLVAPAGYGKTFTIVNCLEKYTKEKQLILTHTHAGVASLKEKIAEVRPKIDPKNYHIETLDSYARKYVLAFYCQEDLPEAGSKNYFPFIREKVLPILQSSFAQKIVELTYQGLFVDEYQDCSKKQHQMVMALAKVLPTHILGDHMQAIFNFNSKKADYKDPLVDLEVDLEGFDKLNELDTPQRWINAGSPELGEKLKHLRKRLKNNEEIDLRELDENCKWIKYHKIPSIENIKDEDEKKRIKSEIDRIYNRYFWNPPAETNIVVIHPTSGAHEGRISFVKRWKKFKRIESIDDKDFYSLAKELDRLKDNPSEQKLVDFLYLKKKNRKNNGEKVKLTSRGDLFVKTHLDKWFNKQGFKGENKTTKETQCNQEIRDDIKKHLKIDKIELTWVLEKIKTLANNFSPRIELLNSLIQASKIAASENKTIHQAMIDHRNMVRRQGRKVPDKCIGTTLLLKGLEFDTVAVLDAQEFKDSKHFYVAITRCCKELIIFSETDKLNLFSCQDTTKKNSSRNNNERQLSLPNLSS